MKRKITQDENKSVDKTTMLKLALTVFYSHMALSLIIYLRSGFVPDVFLFTAIPAVLLPLSIILVNKKKLP